MGTINKLVEDLERKAFEQWVKNPHMLSRRTDPGHVDEYEHPWTCGAWSAWKARAAMNSKCRGVAHPRCNYLAVCGSVCNKCGQQV